MLVLWIATSLILFVILVGLLIPLIYGYIPDISTFGIILALEVTSISLALKRYKLISTINYVKENKSVNQTDNEYYNLSLVSWFEKVLLFDYLDQDFRDNLEECERYLILFEQEMISIRPTLIMQIKAMLRHYYDLSNLLIPTDRSIELQYQIEDFFNRLKESFHKIYESSLEDTFDQIEIDLKVSSEIIKQNLELR